MVAIAEPRPGVGNLVITLRLLGQSSGDVIYNRFEWHSRLEECRVIPSIAGHYRRGPYIIKQH